MRPPRNDPESGDVDRRRIDKWLWHARVVRTRNAAASLVESGCVRINGARSDAPGRIVKAGDVLTITLDARVRVMTIRGFSTRRGAAQSARQLYDE